MTPAAGPSTFEVIPFPSGNAESTTLKKLHQACEGNQRQSSVIAQKDHLTYLNQYLRRLKCQTIVLERQYVDRDYLEDYAAYYVRCFEDYPRKCDRLHFFDLEIDEDGWKSFLERRTSSTSTSLDAQRLGAGYLGFAVLRPLPDAFLGRTCLKTYGRGSTAEERSFPMCRPYHAHVGGETFAVETVPFQEQDNAVSACATAAAWSVLQIACRAFSVEAPTPATITALASDHTHAVRRTFPSDGLDDRDIYEAIRKTGLEVDYVELDDNRQLSELIHSYGSFGLPAILGVVHPEAQEQPGTEPEVEKKVGSQQNSIPGHAIAVTGYAMETDAPRGLFRAHRISKLYAHDDGVGAFARVELQADRDVLVGATAKHAARVETLLVPVYHKIRIPYQRARDEAIRLLELCASLTDLTAPEADIRLIRTNHFLEEVAQSERLSPDVRRRLLERRWPRFLWRVSVYTAGANAIDLLLDATDISRAFITEAAAVYDTDLESAFAAQLRGSPSQAAKTLLSSTFGELWLDVFAEAVSR